MGRATSGAQDDLGQSWSFNTFLTNFDKMHPRAREMVFGGQGADQQIRDIARYSSRLRETDRFRNFSNTARNTLAGAFLTVVGGSLWHGDVVAAGIETAAIPAANVAARLFMETPAMRQWTRTTLRAMTEGSNATLQAQTRRLGMIAAREPAFAQDILGVRDALLKAANDNAGHLAAASDDEEKKRRSGQ